MPSPFASVEKVVVIKTSQAMPGTAAVLALLAELVAEVRGLRSDLAASRSAPNAGSEVANLLREIDD